MTQYVTHRVDEKLAPLKNVRRSLFSPIRTEIGDFQNKYSTSARIREKNRPEKIPNLDDFHAV